MSFAKYVGMGNKVKSSSLAKVKGKTVLVTGGNAGIGYATSKELAKNGAEVIIACRSEARAKASVQQMIQECSCSIDISFRILDLSSLESVKSFVKSWGTKKLNILINNAGIMQCPYSLSPEGYELQFATNHLGHFLLTNLLLPCIADDGRIVNLTSMGHLHCSDPVNWRSLGTKETYDAGIAYGNSKLANIYFTRELQEKLKKQNKEILVSAVHPGVVRTDITRSYHPIAKIFLAPLLFILAKTPRGGAQNSLHCATSPSIIGGGYYSNCVHSKPSDQAEDREAAAKLWEVSEEMTADYLQ